MTTRPQATRPRPHAWGFTLIELLASAAYGSTAARVRAFVEQGGGCRATYFNYRRKLGQEPL